MKNKVSFVLILIPFLFLLFGCDVQTEVKPLTNTTAEEQSITEQKDKANYEIVLISPLKNAKNIPEEGTELSWKAYIKGTTVEATQLVFQVCFSTDNPPKTIIKDSSGRDFFSETKVKTGILKPNTTYYWQVIAKNKEGELFESEIWNFKTKELQPTKLVLLSPTNGVSSLPTKGINFSWKLENATQKQVIFDILISKSENFSDLVWQANTSSNSCTLDKKLEKSTKYFWKVSAKNEAGDRVESDIFNFVTISPTTPTFIEMQPINNSEKIPVENVKFNWKFSDDDGDELNYEFLLYEDTPESTPILTVPAIKNNYYLLNTLKLSYNKIYHWQVIAKDEDGKKASSPVYSFTTISEEEEKAQQERKRLPELTEIYPENGSIISKNKNISWKYSKPLEDDFTVELLIATNTTATPTIIRLPKEITEFTIPSDKLLKGETYYWKLRLKTQDGKTFDYDWYNFSVSKPTVPKPPIPINPKDNSEVNPGTVLLKWSESTDEDGDKILYDILLGSTPSELSVIKTNVQETSLELNNIQRGQKYYWKVIAKDQDGNKIESELSSFSTKLLSDLTIISPKNMPSNIPVKNIKFEWLDEKSDGVTYTLRLGKSKDKMAVISLEQKETSYVYETKLDYNTTYYWRVDRRYKGQLFEGEVYQFTTVGLPKPEKLSPTGVNNPTKNLTLSWEYPLLEAENITFEIHFGTDQESLKKLVENIKEYSFTIPFRLEKERTYYWKVIAKNTYGVYSESDIARFETIPPTQPFKPVVIQPQNESVNTDFEKTILSWKCLDLDNDTLSFYVYLDTVNPPQKLIAETKNTEHKLEKLLSNTKYYWLIVAVDEDGYRSVSDVWSFTTGKAHFSEDFEGEKYSLPNVKINGTVRIINEPNKGRVLELKTAHNSSSEFSFAIELSEKSIIKFDYLISSEENGDFFILYVNDKEIFRDSGEKQWRAIEFPLEPGKYTIKFTYEKDTIKSSGKDCLLIDNIIVK